MVEALCTPDDEITRPSAVWAVICKTTLLVRKMARRNHFKPRRPKSLELSIKNPNAAGIDIGSAFHCVAVPPDRDTESVRTFKSYTPDLHEMSAWLKACSVSTVAMEATGVYWVPVYEILLSHGFDVVVVNPSFVSACVIPSQM